MGLGTHAQHFLSKTCLVKWNRHFIFVYSVFDLFKSP